MEETKIRKEIEFCERTIKSATSDLLKINEIINDINNNVDYKTIARKFRTFSNPDKPRAKLKKIDEIVSTLEIVKNTELIYIMRMKEELNIYSMMFEDKYLKN